MHIRTMLVFALTINGSLLVSISLWLARIRRPSAQRRISLRLAVVPGWLTGGALGTWCVQGIPAQFPIGFYASRTDRVKGNRAEQPHVEHML